MKCRDVLAYKTKRHERSKETMQRLTEESQTLGLSH